MKGIEDILSTLEGKEIDIQVSIDETDLQISILELRKQYLKGRMYEVLYIREAIDEPQRGTEHETD